MSDSCSKVDTTWMAPTVSVGSTAPFAPMLRAVIRPNGKLDADAMFSAGPAYGETAFAQVASCPERVCR